MSKRNLVVNYCRVEKTIDTKSAGQWVADVVSELASCGEVTLLPRATVNGYHDHNFLTIHERCSDHLADMGPVNGPRQRLHRVRAAWVILATGAHERPLVYGNNDVPGCMFVLSGVELHPSLRSGAG